MDETANLKLPYIMAAQAQKHVTHNEAIRALDAVVQLSVLDRDLATPPTTPSDGDRYIVASSATDGWQGHDNEIAAFQDNAWMYYAPLEGWLCWVADEDKLLAWDSTTWSGVSGGGGGSVNPTPLVGVNATADTTNRLSVSSPATLFNHEGDGHQLKINKNAAADTASALFQTGFSGRAEFGTTGDDDWHVKVSPDGSNWFEALVVDKDTGRVSIPSGGLRNQLSANRTYYVRTDGNDSNDGLSNIAGGAFATIQHVVDVVAGLDTSVYNITISVAAGTYLEDVNLSDPAGSGNVTITGPSAANRAQVAVSSFAANGSTRYTLKYLTVNGAVSYLVYAWNGAALTIRQCRIESDNASRYGLYANSGGAITTSTDIEIAGQWQSPYRALNGGRLECYNVQFDFSDLSGVGPSFNKFVRSERLSNTNMARTSHTGSPTGQRYIVNILSLINTGGGGKSFLPGNRNGTASNGGYYL